MAHTPRRLRLSEFNLGVDAALAYISANVELEFIPDTVHSSRSAIVDAIGFFVLLQCPMEDSYIINTAPLVLSVRCVFIYANHFFQDFPLQP